MKLRTVLVVGGSVLTALANNSVVAAQGDLSQGSNLAHEVCSECHAVELGGLRSPNLNAPTFEEIAHTPGMTALAIRIFLQSPHQTMPLFVLDGTEMEDVSAYILSLKQSSP